MLRLHIVIESDGLFSGSLYDGESVAKNASLL